nr:histone H3 [Heliothis virescens nudivirus]
MNPTGKSPRSKTDPQYYQQPEFAYNNLMYPNAYPNGYGYNFNPMMPDTATIFPGTTIFPIPTTNTNIAHELGNTAAPNITMHDLGFEIPVFDVANNNQAEMSNNPSSFVYRDTLNTPTPDMQHAMELEEDKLKFMRTFLNFKDTPRAAPSIGKRINADGTPKRSGIETDDEDQCVDYSNYNNNNNNNKTTYTSILDDNSVMTTVVGKRPRAQEKGEALNSVRVEFPRKEVINSGQGNTELEIGLLNTQYEIVDVSKMQSRKRTHEKENIGGGKVLRSGSAGIKTMVTRSTTAAESAGNTFTIANTSSASATATTASSGSVSSFNTRPLNAHNNIVTVKPVVDQAKSAAQDATVIKPIIQNKPSEYRHKKYVKFDHTANKGYQTYDTAANSVESNAQFDSGVESIASNAAMEIDDVNGSVESVTTVNVNATSVVESNNNVNAATKEYAASNASSNTSMSNVPINLSNIGSDVERSMENLHKEVEKDSANTVGNVGSASVNSNPPNASESNSETAKQINPTQSKSPAPESDSDSSDEESSGSEDSGSSDNDSSGSSDSEDEEPSNVKETSNAKETSNPKTIKSNSTVVASSVENTKPAPKSPKPDPKQPTSVPKQTTTIPKPIAPKQSAAKPKPKPKPKPNPKSKPPTNTPNQNVTIIFKQPTTPRVDSNGIPIPTVPLPYKTISNSKSKRSKKYKSKEFISDDQDSDTETTETVSKSKSDPKPKPKTDAAKSKSKANSAPKPKPSSKPKATPSTFTPSPAPSTFESNTEPSTPTPTTNIEPSTPPTNIEPSTPITNSPAPSTSESNTVPSTPTTNTEPSTPNANNSNSVPESPAPKTPASPYKSPSTDDAAKSKIDKREQQRKYLFVKAPANVPTVRTLPIATKVPRIHKISSEAGGGSRIAAMRAERLKKSQSINFINKNIIRRFAERLGIDRISKDVYPELSRIIEFFMKEVKRRVTLLVECGKRKTVEIRDIKSILKSVGLRVLADDYDYEGRDPGSAKDEKFDVAYMIKLIKSKSCKMQFIPTLPFCRAWKNIEIQIDSYQVVHLRYRGQALLLMRDVTECYLARLLEAAYIVMLNSGRKTLMAKDFKSMIGVKMTDTVNLYHAMFDSLYT